MDSAIWIVIIICPLLYCWIGDEYEHCCKRDGLVIKYLAKRMTTDKRE